MTTCDLTRTAGRGAAPRRTIPGTRILARALAALIGTAIAGCAEAPIEPITDEGGFTVVSITPASHTLTVGDSADFRVQLSAPKDFTVAGCNSSDTAVVITRRQPAQCKVVAVAPGGSTITIHLSTGQAIAGRVTVVAR